MLQGFLDPVGILDGIKDSSKAAEQIVQLSNYVFTAVKLQSGHSIQTLEMMTLDFDALLYICTYLRAAPAFICLFIHRLVFLVSMTTLLMHTVAHSTKPFFRPKTNYQPLKKFFKSCTQLSKRRQKWDVILVNKVV